MDNLKYLSFRALMRHDTICYLCYMLPLVTMILIGAALVIPAAPGAFFVGLLIVMLPVAAVVLAARVLFVRSVYRKGVVVEGKIDDLILSRNWGRLTYSYTLRGMRHSTWNTIVKNNFSTTFFHGKPVMVVVDPDHPRRAFVVELYQG